jgi:hypothetical protein
VTEYAVNTGGFTPPSGQSFVVGFAVSWKAPDGTAPSATQPITMQINNPSIKAGDVIYMVGPNGSLVNVGTATQDGVASLTFTQDPAFLVAAPTQTQTGPTSPVASPPPSSAGGYRMVGSDGGVFDFGSSRFFGSAAGQSASPVVAVVATPDGNGYWIANQAGGVFSFGDAKNFGSLSLQHLAASVVGMAATPDGAGYWLVASDGGVFSFGDATFHGSTGAMHLAAPVVGLAVTP